jgi:high-affinity iron transporter
MFGTFLIGLREGLEATLVVSILVAFLVKSGQRRYLWQVWAGVMVAVALSVGAGAVQTYGSRALTYQGQELFEAIASLVAVAFVTWMIFWMRTAARRIGTDLRTKLEQAIKLGPVAVVVMAFFAVAREGLETSVLLYSALQVSGSGSGPLLAALGGILTAVAIGVGLYYGSVTINLGKFFTWTGALLIFVAAGILKYAIHDFQEAGVLPGLNDHAFDASGWFAADSWYGHLLAGMFNFTPAPSVFETIGWLGYLIPVLLIFLWPAAKTTPAPQTGATPDKPSQPAPAEKSS